MASARAALALTGQNHVEKEQQRELSITKQIHRHAMGGNLEPTPLTPP
jgi:hypothetical protein